MLAMISQEYDDVDGQYTRLSEVGITIGSQNQLQFDETKLREALSTDLEAVTELFSLKTQAAGEQEQIQPGVTIPAGGPTVTAQGVGATLDALLEALTDSIDGTLTVATDRLDTQIELNNDRIEQLNLLLADKRERLEAQFTQMEIVLAQMQAQQNSLASLTSLALRGAS
jgi:flagellar hook-associated protein 2